MSRSRHAHGPVVVAGLPACPRRRTALLRLAAAWSLGCGVLPGRAGAQEGRKTLPAAQWQRLRALPGITVPARQRSGVHLVVFFDANCPACAHLWRELYGEYRGARDVGSHWVPVAYLSKDSLDRAATLLDRGTAEALHQNYRQFDAHRKQGGVPPTAPSAFVKAVVAGNRKAWEQLGPATPLIVLRTRDGQVQAQVGVPPSPQLDALLQQAQG